MSVTIGTQTPGRWVALSFVAATVLAMGGVIDVSAQDSGGYVGSETCAGCHEEVATTFQAAAHGRVDLEEWDGVEGCESCHGPGANHAEEGDSSLIRTFGSISPAEVARTCTSCHSGLDMTYWNGSTHQTMKLDCTSCHAVHKPWTDDRALVNKNKTDACLSCHPAQRKSLNQRSNHPIKFGQMSCDDCHDPHGTATVASIGSLSVNDKCWECHAETRGPFLWNHAPVQEDCTKCHASHGSNQAMLLKVSAPRLCQSCHLFGHHQTVPGEPDQVWNTNRSCLNCHPRIHGSNHPSGVVFMR